jgi:hypothetical protein
MQRMPWEATKESRPCFSIRDPSKKVECILDCVEKTGYFFNVHIYPQAFIFDTWTDWGLLDIALILYDISDITTVMQSLSGQKGDVHARESNKDGKHDKITVDELGPALIERICRLYEVDTTLLQLLGMHDPDCMATEKSLGDSTKEQSSDPS